MFNYGELKIDIGRHETSRCVFKPIDFVFIVYAGSRLWGCVGAVRLSARKAVVVAVAVAVAATSILRDLQGMVQSDEQQTAPETLTEY